MSTALVRQLANDVIGRDQIITTPFGDHVLTYADFTASGRALHSVEAFLHHNVLPFYGNTHTTTSATGLHMTRFREDARHIIAQAVHATDDDAVIFTGSGTTGAVHKLVAALGLDVRLPAFVEPVDRPVVFVGPFEHDSNLLCWRESGADVVVVPEDGSGHVDVAELARRLAQFASRRLKIGAFSAASNLTGVLTDVDVVTSTLHTHGALAFGTMRAPRRTLRST